MKQYNLKVSTLAVLVASNLTICQAIAKAESESKANANDGKQIEQKVQRVSHLMATTERCKSLTEETITVPFTRGEAGHVLVEGKFNQHSENAVVDTGGIGVGGVVSEKAMMNIQPEDNPDGEVDVQGASHSQAMKFTRLKSTGVGDVQSGELNYVISPKAILDGEAEALIGTEFLCSFTTEFNFADGQLSLHPKTDSIEDITRQPSYQKKQWGSVTNQAQILGALVMDMTINGQKVKAVLDTGARHSIMNWRAASLLGIEKTSPNVVVEDKSFGGIHGKSKGKAYRVKLNEVVLAGTEVSLTDMDMRISDLGSFKPLVGDAPAINLGVDFFEGRQLIIDYANRKIAVSK